jgi:protein-S-isoprenylcysteine O-methyltransferase Ste14
MSKRTSRVITAISFPFGPGIVVVLVPFLITRFNEGAPLPSVVRIIGVVLIALSALLVLSTFARFAHEGQGSPFPTNPPTSRQVMKGGPYRYVRNPMYVSFYVCLVGEVLLLDRPVLLIYDAALIVALFLFVHFYEQRTMTKRFGAEYIAYCQQVPGWWPRWPHRAN